MQTWPREVILAEHLFQAVFGVPPSVCPDREMSQRWKLLAPIAQKAGIEKLPRPFALFGRPKVKVWVLRNAQRWRGAHVLDIEQELCRPN